MFDIEEDIINATPEETGFDRFFAPFFTPGFAVEVDRRKQNAQLAALGIVLALILAG